MARTLGDAYVRVRPDTTGFRSEAEGGMSKALKRAAVVAAAATTAGLAKFSAAAVGSASQVQQSYGAVESVFAKASGQVKRFSRDAATSVGLARSEYAQLAAVFGSQLRNMGVAEKELFPTTNKLIGLGADLSAMFGGTAAEAVEAISSLLRGERDPIERYGVSIKQATIDAHLASKGLDDLTGAAKRQAETQATLALLFQQTSKAQGQFGRESETFAGVQQRLGAQWENLKATVGAGLLPVLSQAGTAVSTQVLPPLISMAEKWAPRISARISEWISGADLSGYVERAGAALRDIDWDSIASSVSKLVDRGKELGPAFQEASAQHLPVLNDLLDVAGTVLKFAADNVDLLAKALPYLAGAFLLVKTAQTAANVAATLSVPVRIAEVVATRAQTKALQAHTAAQSTGVVAQTVSNTATAAGTKITIRQRIATIASTVATKAATVATKVWTVAQRALNLALRMNPIGLIITALIALGAGLVIAYKKSETFRRIVNKAWASIKGAVQTAWRDTIKPALRAFWGFLRDTLWPLIQRFWTNGIKPVFRAIGAAIGFAWNKVIKPVLKAWWAYVSEVLWPVLRFLWSKVVRPVFGWIGDKIATVWRKVIRPAFRAMGDFVTGTLQPAFKRGVDAIGRIWNGLKSAARKPVEFIVNTVYMKGIKPVIDAIPGVPDLPAKRFVKGGWTGPGSKYQPAGVVDADEHVWTKAESSRFPGGHRGLERLRKATMHGKLDGLPRFFLGGRVPTRAASISQHSGYPWASWAGDINGPGNDYGQPVRAWKSGIVMETNRWLDSYGKNIKLSHGDQRSLYAHLSSIFVKPWQQVRQGQLLGLLGSSGNSTGPHLHFEVAGGSGLAAARKAGDGGNVLTRFLDAIGAAKDFASDVGGWVSKVTNMGGWGGMLADALRSVLGNMRGWVNDKIPGPGPLPDLFDRGGYARGAGLLAKGPRPERVLNPRQTAAFERLVDTIDRSHRRPPPGGGGDTYNVYETTNPHATAREIARQQAWAGAG